MWEAARSKIKEDALLVVEGKVSADDFSGGLRIVADNLLTLVEARGRYARALRLSLNGQSTRESAGRLHQLLSPYRCTAGASPVRIRYRNAEAETEIALPDAWRVRLDDRLIDTLSDWLQRENVEVVYA